MKTCARCRVVLTDENAPRVNTGKQAGEFRAYCRPCAILHSAEYRQRNQKKVLESGKKYREKNREKILASARRRGKLRRFREANLTESDFYRLLSLQSHRCKICRRILLKKTCLDHCHATGRVRGILCNNCNTGLGLFKDSPEILRNAVDYLLSSGH